MIKIKFIPLTVLITILTFLFALVFTACVDPDTDGDTYLVTVKGGTGGGSLLLSVILRLGRCNTKEK